MQNQIILGINKEQVVLYEEISRETIMDIKLEEIMNWGINKDIFVICYGDKYEVTKLYFQCFNPFEIADILFNYSNEKILKEKYDMVGEHEELNKFIWNPKIRKMTCFNFR